MRCTFCGHDFEESEAEGACSGCPLKGTCEKVKCPNCGFEIAPTKGAWQMLLDAWLEVGEE